MKDKKLVKVYIRVSNEQGSFESLVGSYDSTQELSDRIQACALTQKVREQSKIECIGLKLINTLDQMFVSEKNPR